MGKIVEAERRCFSLRWKVLKLVHEEQPNIAPEDCSEATVENTILSLSFLQE